MRSPEAAADNPAMRSPLASEPDVSTRGNRGTSASAASNAEEAEGAGGRPPPSPSGSRDTRTPGAPLLRSARVAVRVGTCSLPHAASVIAQPSAPEKLLDRATMPPYLPDPFDCAMWASALVPL